MIRAAVLIWILCTGFYKLSAQGPAGKTSFMFYGEEVILPLSRNSVPVFSGTLTIAGIQNFHDKIKTMEELAAPLIRYREKNRPDDWLYYQLIRKAAESISPKLENYHQYTLYKWFLLTRSGFDAILTISGNTILFYVASENNIYNIPLREKNGRNYVCLNYHDYAPIDFKLNSFAEVPLPVDGAEMQFSYRITHLPRFDSKDFTEKELEFVYNQIPYRFRVKLNPHVKNIFTNYPSSDYGSHFDIPLSHETYTSLIPGLKKAVKGLNVKNGVDFLMNFTRYAFLFKPDTESFGSEKRLSPEQTLLYDYSDCEDRSALFFFLVKEIYRLPMIVLAFPGHVTIAVKFEKPVGETINYKGSLYSICEPSPQKYPLAVGQMLPELKNASYEITHVYAPR